MHNQGLMNSLSVKTINIYLKMEFDTYFQNLNKHQGFIHVRPFF